MKTPNGVDTHYVGKNLDRLMRDFKGTPRDEIARAMLRLAGTVDQVERDRVIRDERSSLILADGTYAMLICVREGLDGYSAVNLARTLTRYAQSLDFRVTSEPEFEIKAPDAQSPA